MLKLSSQTGVYELEPCELLALVQGEFRARKCLACNGTGWLHFDGEGTVLGCGFKRDFESEDSCDWVDSEGCDTCDGLGQIITLDI